jgi:hypothetical protein
LSSVKQSAIWDLETRQLILPKLGHEPSECEDAIAMDAQSSRFAVADGATEAFDARNWAQRLAQHWVQNESVLTPGQFRTWVAAEGRELHDSWNGLSLSWYSEEKARNGSFAAFVGVEFDLRTESPSWKAIALGDTCLLHCRSGSLLKGFPLSRSESFIAGPVLVASDCALHESSMQEVVIDSGSCNSGDVLLLLSDGVACWYLERLEKNDFNPNEFLRTTPDDELARFFDDERTAGRMRNDDIAVLRIEINERGMT